MVAPQRVWRIIHKQTGEFLPAPRNSMGVYATQRGAKAGLTHFGEKLRLYRRRNESIDDYEIQPFFLVPEQWIVEKTSVEHNVIIGNEVIRGT